MTADADAPPGDDGGERKPFVGEDPDLVKELPDIRRAANEGELLEGGRGLGWQGLCLLRALRTLDRFRQTIQFFQGIQQFTIWSLKRLKTQFTLSL